MKTTSNNNNIESKKVQLDDPKGKVNTEFFTPGTRYLCIKSVKGDFTKGSIYEQSSDPTQWYGYFRNDKGEHHVWPQPDNIAHNCEQYDMKPEDIDPRLYFEPVEEITQAEGIQVGDRVRHNKHAEVATVTAIREAFVNDCDGYRYLYTLDFGQSVRGPFGVELNGGEFLREAFTPCTPDGRELLPEPPAKVTISTDSESHEPTLYERHNITAGEREAKTKGSASYIRRQARLACCAFYSHKGARIEVRIAYRNGTDDPDGMSYKVCWYDETRTGELHLVECENGISLEQAARHMADFSLLSECGLTLREILYPAA